jgi:hypothetical protein
MILPKEQESEIIEGLLPLLVDCFENTERVRTVPGSTLIKEGVNFDVKGKRIVATKKYVIADTVRIQVNHKRRLREVINRAKTLDGMNDDLARYLVKFGQSKQAITDSIPEHLRTNKQ